MTHSIRSLIAVAACGCGSCFAAPAFATSFIIADGQTATDARTLTDRETGRIEAGGALSLSGSDGDTAITVSGDTRIDNAGTLSSAGDGRLVRDDKSGDVSLRLVNEAGALMESNDADVIQLHEGDTVRFDNYGTVRSANVSEGGAQAIDFNNVSNAANTIDNHAGAIIEAYEADAVRPGENGDVINAGTIRATNAPGRDDGSDGVDAQDNSGVTIVNGAAANADTGALIEGARHGITGGNTDTDTDGTYRIAITNNAGGTIRGDDGSGINIDGFNGNEIATVRNAGTIIGDGVTGDGDGVDVDGLVDLDNAGTIVSQGAAGDNSEGVTVGGGTIVNSGLIEGDTRTAGASRGITLGGVDKDPDTGDPIPTQGIYADTTIDNSGTIRGATGSAINVAGQANDHSVTIINEVGGVLSGGGDEAAVYTGATHATITNRGRIQATGSGPAVDLGAGDSALIIAGGQALVDGDIDGGSGASMLAIEPGSGNRFIYTDDIANVDTLAIGAGTTVLDGQSSNLGDTTVAGGTLVVGDDDHAAAELDSALTLDDGATLAGIGSVASVTVGDGATVSPGNSVGTLHVAGDLSFAAGSTLAVGVDGRNSDTLQVAGTAMINGGRVALDGNPTPGITYTLIDAGRIEGRFAGMADAGHDWLFVDPTLGYTDRSVTFTLERNSTPFAHVASTANQRAVADGLERLDADNRLKRSLLQLQSVAGARQAYDSLSGEAFASEQTAWFNDSRYIRDAVSARRQPDCAEQALSSDAMPGDRSRRSNRDCAPGAWGQWVGDWGHWRGGAGAAGLDHHVAGALVGADRAFGDARLGLVAGLTHGDSSVQAGRDSRIKTDNYQLGVYASQQFGALGAQLGVAYAYHDANAHRRIVFTDTRADAEYHGHTEQAFGGLSYALNTGATTQLTPFARLAYIRLSSNAFAEHGGGAADLQARGVAQSYGETHLGLALDRPLGGARAPHVASVRLQLGWQHVIGSTTPRAELAFADGTSDFVESGAAIARDAGRIRAGLRARLSRDAHIDVGYQGQFGDGAAINGLRARLTF